MRFNKKILSLVLAGAMVVSLAPSNVGVVSKTAAASYDEDDSDYDPSYQKQEVIKDGSKTIGKITYTNKAYFGSYLSYGSLDNVYSDKITYYYGDYEKDSNPATVSAITSSNNGVSDYYKAKAAKEIADTVDEDADDYKERLNNQIKEDLESDIKNKQVFTAKFDYYYYTDDGRQSGTIKLTYDVSEAYKVSDNYNPYAIYKYKNNDDDDDYSSYGVLTSSSYLSAEVNNMGGAPYYSPAYKWYKLDESGKKTELENFSGNKLYLTNSGVIDPKSKTDDKFVCEVSLKNGGYEIQTFTLDYTVYKVASSMLYKQSSETINQIVYAKTDKKVVLASDYEAANGATAEYVWEKYNYTDKKWEVIKDQTGKTYTIDKCTEDSFGNYRVTCNIYVGKCLYTSINEDADGNSQYSYNRKLVQNPPYSINHKAGYSISNYTDDKTGKAYAYYYKGNNVIPGESDSMTVDVKEDEGYKLEYKWYELKDGSWSEITTDDAKTNVYNKTFTNEDFDKEISKEYKCVVTATKNDGTSTYDKSYFEFYQYRDPELYADYKDVKYGSRDGESAENKKNVQKTAIGAAATLKAPKVSVNSQYQVVYKWQKKTSITSEEYYKNYIKLDSQGNKLKDTDGSYLYDRDYFTEYDYDDDTDEGHTNYYKWAEVKDATSDTYGIANVTNTSEKNDFGLYRVSYDVYKAGADLTKDAPVEIYESDSDGNSIISNYYIDLEEFCGFKAIPRNTEDIYTLDIDGTIDLGVVASLTNTEANNQKYDLTYQWQKYDSATVSYKNIDGATTADYKKEKITAEDFGKYQCVVTVVDKTTKAAIKEVEPAPIEFTIKQAEKKEGILKLNSEPEYVLQGKNINDAVTLSVSATTDNETKYPLTYKWEKIEKNAYSDDYGNYVEIAGANTKDYALTLTNDEAFTTYRCTVSNGADTAKVTFNVLKNDNFYAYAAATKSNEKTFIKKAGESVKMQVVNGSDDTAATFTYKWFKVKSNTNKKGSDSQSVRIPDATSSTYEIASLTEEDLSMDSYYCVVKNELTKETKTVTFYVKKYDTTDITFTDLDGTYDNSDTSDVEVELGSTKEFGAVVKNPESKNFIYKWSFAKLHKDDTNYDYDYERALDCTTEKLTLSNITEDDLGTYTLRIYEGSAADDDTPVITHYFEVSKKDAAAKKFTLSAVGNGQRAYYRSVGGNVTFATELSTESTDAVTYQWYKGDDAIYGETGSSLSLTNLRIADFGTYACVAKAGTLTSRLTFSVSEADAITVDWNNDNFRIDGNIATYNKTVKAKIGDSTNLTAVVTSATGDAVSYQWYEEDTEKSHYNFYAKEQADDEAYKIMQGQTTDTLALNQMTKDSFKNYKLEITNGGYTVNVFFTLVRTDLPKVSVKADKRELEKGESAVLTAKVTNLGDKTATYQWYKNGKKIDGATAATYTTEALFSDLNELKDAEKSVTYKCEVSTDIDKVSDEISLNFAGWGTISQTKEFAMKGDTVDIGINMKEAGDWKYTWYKKDAVSGEYVKVPEATSATISAIATSDDSKKDDNNRYRVVAEKGSDETYVRYYADADVEVFNISDMTTYPSGKVAAYNKDADEDTDNNQYFGYSIDGASKLRMTFSKDSNLYDSNADFVVYELDTQKIRYFDGYDLAGRTYVFDSGKCVFKLTGANNTKYTSGTDGVTVEKAINPDVDYSKLTVSKKSVKLNAGKSATITYSALDNFGDTTKVTAKTSNKKVATVSVAAGKVTIKAASKAKGAAKAKITLTNGTKTATIKVTINNPVKTLKAAKKKATVKKKKTVKLTFKVTSYNKAKKTSDKITYKTSKKKIAKITKKTVSSKKIVVSVKGLKKGTSKITVTVGKKKAVVTVKVK